MRVVVLTARASRALPDPRNQRTRRTFGNAIPLTASKGMPGTITKDLLRGTIDGEGAWMSWGWGNGAQVPARLGAELGVTGGGEMLVEVRRNASIAAGIAARK